MNSKPLDQDINYLQGQIDGLKALLLGIANLTLDAREFREQGLQRIGIARDAVMSQPVPDSRIAGIDVVETWLKNVTR